MNRRDAIKRAALLSGYAITASAMTGILQSCEQAEQKDIWQPSFFDQDQINTLAEMTETILPRTETPGAKDVGVHQFLDTFIKEVKYDNEQQLILKGLERANADCQAVYGYRFEECTPSEKEQLLQRYDELTAIDKEAPNDPNAVDMGKFFKELKGMTMFAYFTSAEIAKNHFHYEPIPGKFEGCIDLASIDGKAQAPDR